MQYVIYIKSYCMDNDKWIEIFNILNNVMPKVLINIVGEYYGNRYIGYKKCKEFGDGEYISKVMCFHNKLYVMKELSYDIELHIFDMDTYELLRNIKYEDKKTLNDENLPYLEIGNTDITNISNNIFRYGIAITFPIQNLEDGEKQRITFYDWYMSDNQIFSVSKREIFVFNKDNTLNRRMNMLCDIENMTIIKDDIFLILVNNNKNKLYVIDKGDFSITEFITESEPQFISSIGNTLFVSTNKKIYAYNFMYRSDIITQNLFIKN